MSTAVFPDNTVLCNFAAIDRLDLLLNWLRGRGRWCAAVRSETIKSTPYLPPLAVLTPENGPLGAAIDIDDEEVIQQIEAIRINGLGGMSDEPLKHLGEAQTCYIIERDFRGALWVSDDADACDYARFKGIRVYRTFEIFCEIVTEGELTAGEALELMIDMDHNDRNLYIPRDTGEFLS